MKKIYLIQAVFMLIIALACFMDSIIAVVTTGFIALLILLIGIAELISDLKEKFTFNENEVNIHNYYNGETKVINLIKDKEENNNDTRTLDSER